MALIKLNNQSLTAVSALPAAITTGSVLKVSGTTTSTQSAYADNSGEQLVMSISHVAVQTNSHFFISGNILFGCAAGSEENAHMILKDGSTKILSGADSGSRIGCFASSDSGSNFNRCQMLNNSGLYTTSTHSAGDTKTFNLYFYAPGSSASYVINKSWNDSDGNFYPRGASHFTVMEIAG